MRMTLDALGVWQDGICHTSSRTPSNSHHITDKMPSSHRGTAIVKPPVFQTKKKKQNQYVMNIIDEFCYFESNFRLSILQPYSDNIQ